MPRTRRQPAPPRRDDDDHDPELLGADEEDELWGAALRWETTAARAANASFDLDNES